jgi:hypothetical protein
MISGFCHTVDEVCTLLGQYTAEGGNSLSEGADGVSQNVGKEYYCMLHKVTEVSRSQRHIKIT